MGLSNKLPSVNQLVGQPPPHGSAAGPNLGPMGEWLGQGGWGGGLGSLAPDPLAQLRTTPGLLLAGPSSSSGLSRNTVLCPLRSWEG